MPKKIKADRGEFESDKADKLMVLLIQVINTPPYRGDLKGIVERHFRIVHDRIKLHWVPGIVHKDFKARGGRDYRLDAKLTLKAFEQIIVLTILEHNNKIMNGYALDKEMMKSNVTPTPLNIWNWGIRHRSGLLKKVTRDEIRLCLMPSSKASVTENGVVFNKMRYSSEEAFRDGWFDRARRKRWTEVIHYDPRDIANIYIGKQKFRLVDEDKRFSGFRIEEVQEQQLVMETQIELSGTSQKQLTIDTNAEIEKIVNEERVSTNNAQINLESNSKKLAGISENRQVEKEFQRDKEKWSDTFEENKERVNAQVINLHDNDTDDSDYLLNLIIDHDKERRGV